MKYILFLSIIFGLTVWSCSSQKSSKATRPNILLINIDDLGWRDVGYSGSAFYETPRIDALSKKGMLFTNGYAAAANCAPSRASLMTGLWTQRHGIMTVGSSARGKSENRKLIPIENKTTIEDRFQLLPETLKDYGYATCHAGKWHLSNDPLTQGFEVNIGGSHAGHPKSYYPPYKNVDLQPKDNSRLTDHITDLTIEFIHSSNRPFFINYAPYAVHTPIQPVPELLSKYKSKPKGLNGKSNVDYATMIENMDVNVGRLIDALKAADLYEQTLIIFTSDNGGLFAVSQQQPLRSGKGSYYEGGIRVPFFFVWPKHIAENQVSEIPISNIDVFPTILGAIKTNDDNSIALDGTNLLSHLEGKVELESRPLFWHFPVYLQAVLSDNENRDPLFRTRPGSVIRFENYKLHHYFEDDAYELYNLQSDVGETTNLAEAMPEKLNQMKALLSKWRSETKAPIPTELNKEFKK